MAKSIVKGVPPPPSPQVSRDPRNPNESAEQIRELGQIRPPIGGRGGCDWNPRPQRHMFNN